MKNFVESLLSKYTNITDIVKCAGIILLVPIVLTGCSTHRVDRLKNKSYKEWKSFEWKEVKRSPNRQADQWTIYSRKLNGTDLLEYKIESNIKCSPTTCVASFKQDLYNLAKSSNIKKYPTYEIVEEGKDSLLTYVIHNEPFPFKDTEMSIRYTFFSDKDGSTGVKWNEAWDEYSVKASKKLSRVETFRGSWYFFPTSNNSCKTVKSVQFNLGGMPLWLAEPMVIKFLREGLEDIKEMTA
jgi:hypothetical protein